MDNTFDKLFYDQGNLIAGIDESGVVDIAGPLVAACVIFPKKIPENVSLFGVDDCKIMPEKLRKEYVEIIWNDALAIGIGVVTVSEIDSIGPSNSANLAMNRALRKCLGITHGRLVVPDFIIVDGDKPVHTKIKQITVLEADKKSLAVAAASIVAKVHRDDIMAELHEKYPYYGWNSNKGYPCKDHFNGLDSHGAIAGIHRTKFWPFVGRAKEDKNPKDIKGRWSRRRTKWKLLTEKNLLNSEGNNQWTSKPVLLNHFLNSKTQLKKGEKSGKVMKTEKKK